MGWQSFLLCCVSMLFHLTPVCPRRIRCRDENERDFDKIVDPQWQSKFQVGELVHVCKWHGTTMITLAPIIASCPPALPSSRHVPVLRIFLLREAASSLPSRPLLRRSPWIPTVGAAAAPAPGCAAPGRDTSSDPSSMDGSSWGHALSIQFFFGPSHSNFLGPQAGCPEIAARVWAWQE